MRKKDNVYCFGRRSRTYKMQGTIMFYLCYFIILNFYSTYIFSYRSFVQNWIRKKKKNRFSILQRHFFLVKRKICSHEFICIYARLKRFEMKGVCFYRHLTWHIPVIRLISTPHNAHTRPRVSEANKNGIWC
jgi:hypothetical protein